MPKLWNDTIDVHRQAVRDAVLNAAAAIVAAHGLHAVTMSQIAIDSGIGRATLYKYFPGLPAILAAWHERQIAGHLAELDKVSAAAPDAFAGLHAVLETYARLSAHGHHGDMFSAMLHQSPSMRQGEVRLHALVRALIAGAIDEGRVRADIPPAELASFCLAAFGATNQLHEKAATRRLIELVLSGLRPAT